MPTTFGLNRTLGSAIGAIALVSILSSGAVLHALNQLHDATEARRRVVLVLRDLDAFRTAMLNQETGLRGYLITGKDSSLEPYRGGRSALNEVANRLRGFVGTDAEPSKLLEEAIVAAQTWQKDIGEAAIRLAADPATRPDAVRIEAEGKGKQFFDTLREKLAAIEATEEKNRLVQTERLAGAERDAKITLWLGALLTLVFCAGIGIAINRWIVRPLGGVLGFVERVGTGDLTGRTAVTGRDEVGRLGTTLNAMVAGLSDLARSNRSATADLNAAAAEIRASAQQQAARSYAGF